jgi:hypothetical protein
LVSPTVRRFCPSVMSWHVMWCDGMWCDGMWWNVMWWHGYYAWGYHECTLKEEIKWYGHQNDTKMKN